MNTYERPTKRSKIDDADDTKESIQKLMAINQSFLSLERALPASSSVDILRAKINEAADRLLSEYEKEIDSFTEDVAIFLSDLDDRKHDEETVKGVIQAVPNALAYDHGGTQLYPIGNLLRTSHGTSFVPLLATESKRLKIFPDSQKCGLHLGNYGEQEAMRHFLETNGCLFILCERLNLSIDEYDRRKSDKNDAEFQTLEAEIAPADDEKRCYVLQQLIELGLFQKKYIHSYIASASVNSSCKIRFEYLVNLCPESFSMRYYHSAYEMKMLPIEEQAMRYEREGFGTLLKAGLKYYPKKLGFLFGKNPEPEFEGKRNIEFALPRISVTHEELFQWIHEAIPPSDDHTILHDIIRLAPKYFSLFWKYYPNAVYLRDDKGRLPLHIALQRASKWSPLLLSLIAINNPTDRHEKDPVTGLCPFMSAASGKSNDLNVIYFLLRRDPNEWEGFRASSIFKK